MRDQGAQAASGFPRGHPQYRFRGRATKDLGVEPRRALAVFRALNLADDVTGSHKLLSFAGRRVGDDRAALVIAPSDCNALAVSLRAAGYPLNDDGIRAFKMERGFSDAVRIGPDVARAYARFVGGVETKLNVGAQEWTRLSEEVKNAVSLLLLIGRRPEILTAVRAALGIRDAASAPQGTILVGRVSGERLVEWAHVHGWALDRHGLARIARARGAPTATIDEDLSRFVASAVRCVGEPTHDYKRLVGEGHTLNRRTVFMLKAAERLLPREVRFRVLQGSYLGGVERGAHPHMGGGVVDLAEDGLEAENIERVVQALRSVGFAAWHRTRSDHPHIHAVAIGDRELSPAARWQVNAYFAGRDGRSRKDRDPHRHVEVALPAWVTKYRIGAVDP
ncbi:MAG: hypothetical protein HY903_10700 [Deltaproteobacteria bacterium]|nr:hypothetical protein [Deltaproteobacteria bacterium]